jgi:transposase-like protein
MAESRRKFDEDFKQGAVRMVQETGKPMHRWPESWASMRAHSVTGAPRTGGSVRDPAVR